MARIQSCAEEPAFPILHSSQPDKCRAQVEGCKAKSLYHPEGCVPQLRICELHRNLSYLVQSGQRMRFCSYCGAFHPLAAFDGVDRRAVLLCARQAPLSALATRVCGFAITLCG